MVITLLLCYKSDRKEHSQWGQATLGKPAGPWGAIPSCGLTTGQGWPLILPIHKYDNQERVCANHTLGDMKVKMLIEYLIVGNINHNLD